MASLPYDRIVRVIYKAGSASSFFGVTLGVAGLWIISDLAFPFSPTCEWSLGTGCKRPLCLFMMKRTLHLSVCGVVPDLPVSEIVYYNLYTSLDY